MKEEIISKIYNSTEYIKNPVVGDLKLEVNSMWDFKSRSICFQSIPKSFGGDTELIAYDLKECIEIANEGKSTKWKQAEITDEIIKELIEKGYSLAKEYQAEEIPQFKGTLEQLDNLIPQPINK